MDEMLHGSRPEGRKRRIPFGRNRLDKPRKPHVSEILRRLCAETQRERVSLADLIAAMGDRAFGALMLVFALPNVVPNIPGASAILGLPLVFLSAQMTFGRDPWLPRFIGERSMRHEDFVMLIDRIEPWLSRAEKLLKPRMSGLTMPPGENVIGAFCLLMSLILILPIPLGNILPALAISLFAFAMLERDGVWVLLGGLVSLATVIVVSGVIYALGKAAVFLFSNALD